MRKIKSILRQPVKNIGQAGDVVEIRRGYFHYLENLGKVQYATKENMKDLEDNLSLMREEDHKRKQQAEQWSESVKSMTLYFDEEGSDTGVLYGSVTARHISKAIKAQGFDVASSQVRVSRPLKDCGEYDVSIDLHPSVQVQVKVVIRLKNDSMASAAH